MKTKKLAIGLASGVVAIALSVTSTPAFAAINFETATWLVGGVNYQFEWDSPSVNSYGGVEYLTTPTQANSTLQYEETFWNGGDLAPYDDYGYCLGATATEVTEANGDVAITCAPLNFEPSDVWISQSFLFYNDEPLTRHVFSLENRGAVATDLAAVEQENYVTFYTDNVTEAATSEDATSCLSMTAEDHWAVLSGSADTIITGVAWQAHGGTAFTSLGEDCIDRGGVYAYLTKDSLAAGETVNYMTFIATGQPAGPSSGEMDTAFATAVTEMAAFDSLNDTLCRGIDGLVVEGWGTCTLSLPDTGASTAVVGSSIAIGSGLLIAGALALVMARRRQARS
jgi:hypothetical protein